MIPIQLRPWSVRRERSDEVVFVLGAGASTDAGLPLAADLTRALVAGLLERVPSARPVIEAIDRIGDLGLLRPDAHATDRPSGDYESLFSCLRTLLDQPALRRTLGIDALSPAAHEGGFKKLHRDLGLAIRDLTVTTRTTADGVRRCSTRSAAEESSSSSCTAR